MKELDNLIDDLREREEEKVSEAARIRETAKDTSFTDGGAVESTFLHIVSPAELDNVTIAGVDGGLMRKELHGIDFIMARAVAPVFSYDNGKLTTHTYHPSKTPTPKLEYSADRIDRNDADRLSSLLRLQEEVNCAVDAVQNHEPDVLMMDGAILPQYPDKPSKDSLLLDIYEEVMDAYMELYRSCQNRGVLLAGIVEDTRSSNLCNLLAENGVGSPVLEQSRDSHLLSYLLEKGERTLLMQYSHNEHHPILSDLSGHGDNIYSFYLKTVKNDRPLRIDTYIGTERDAETVTEQIASYVCALTAGSESYGIPSIIIEADRCAKLEHHEVDMALERIYSKLGMFSGTQDLRRNRRPF